MSKMVKGSYGPKSKAPDPETFAATGSEDGAQIALMMWASLLETRAKYPELQWLFHVPNGGSRHIAEAGKLVAMGVKVGVPDLWLPVKRKEYAGLIIELKKPDGKNKPTKDQNEWIDYLCTQGYGAVVCYGYEQAKKMLIEYLNWGK